MKDLFFEFLQSPDRDSYLAVHKTVVASQHYAPYSSEIEDIDKLLKAEKYDAARKKAARSMPNLLLSPSAHLLLSFIAEKLNETEESQMEHFIALTCCRGIQATGDGSKATPYIVTRPSDEHDLVRYLDKKFSRQTLINDGDRQLDQIRCVDGSEMYFDITDAYSKLADRYGESR